MFQKQMMMRKVLYALLPLLLLSLYVYKIDALVNILTTFIFGILTEYLFLKKQGKKVTESVLVTCSLYALALPPELPIWLVGTGIVFGVLFGKMVFGGFGRNVFNPAIAGRLFVYINFPNTVNHWIPVGGVVDGSAGATYLETMRGGVIPSFSDVFLKFKSGSIGEISSILILLGGAYLFYTKTANIKSFLSTVIGFFIVQGVVFSLGKTYVPPHIGLFSGSILFVAVFMSTDPVTAPKKPLPIIVYGFIIGGATALIRTFSLFPEGTSFAILLGNTFAPLLDDYLGKYKLTFKKPSTQGGGSSGK